jgi:hypothetical protein
LMATLMGFPILGNVLGFLRDVTYSASMNMGQPIAGFWAGVGAALGRAMVPPAYGAELMGSAGGPKYPQTGGGVDMGSGPSTVPRRGQMPVYGPYMGPGPRQMPANPQQPEVGLDGMSKPPAGRYWAPWIPMGRGPNPSGPFVGGRRGRTVGERPGSPGIHAPRTVRPGVYGMKAGETKTASAVAALRSHKNPETNPSSIGNRIA